MAAHRTLADVTCLQCGAVFRPANRGRKYCSRACTYRAQIKVNPRKCAHCGNLLPDGSRARAYCSKACAYHARSTWKPDNRLKARFIAETRSRHLSASAAARQADLLPVSVSNWLRHKDHRLETPQITKIAAWLGIGLNEAIKLQGGSAEERTHEIALRAAQSPARLAYLERLKHDPAYRRTIAQVISDANRGKHVSPETRAKMSVAVARRFQEDPTRGSRAARHMNTKRATAHRILANLRRWRPGLTPDEQKAEAIRRLLLPPHNVKTDDDARALFAPKPKPRPIRRRASRHPHRCPLLQAMDAEIPRLPSGRRAHRFMPEFERRLRPLEGDRTPDYLVLKDWIADHERRCRKNRSALANGRLSA
jgi:hypothetical protein